MALDPSKPLYFETPAEVQAWFTRHHDRADEVWLGFHRKGTGLPSVSYTEALDEAICWGWIDGIRKRWDETSYVQRFTPRRRGSIWSLVNIAKVEQLQAEGRMQPAGLEVFARRTAARTGVYSFERKTPPTFTPARLAAFQAQSAAWTFFSTQAPYYRRVATHWVESAKREETQKRRFETLLHHSAKGERLPQLTPGKPTQ